MKNVIINNEHITSTDARKRLGITQSRIIIEMTPIQSIAKLLIERIKKRLNTIKKNR
jgi:hypothetical protein